MVFKFFLFKEQICKMEYHLQKVFLLIVLISGVAIARVITVNNNGNADFNTIQEAINSSEDGDTIFVKVGIYSEWINIDKNILLLGEDRDSTIITIEPITQFLPLVNFTKQGIIKEFTINGTNYTIGIGGIAAIVENNIIKNNNAGISLEYGTIRNNIIENNFFGILIDYGTIDNNIIKDNNIGISFRFVQSINQQLIIEKNEISQNENAIISEGIFPDSLIYLGIVGNNINNNTSGIVLREEVPINNYLEKTDSTEYVIDAKWNWWGTIEEDSINEKILDNQDIEENLIKVDYSEWLLEPNDINNYTYVPGIHYNNFYSNSNLNIETFKVITSIEEDYLLDNKTFFLHQNYPNPFNPSTTINFEIGINNVLTRLEIYDALGCLIKILIDKYLNIGRYSVEWDGRDEFNNEMTSGIYFCQLTAGNFTKSKKLILVK